MIKLLIILTDWLKKFNHLTILRTASSLCVGQIRVSGELCQNNEEFNPDLGQNNEEFMVI